MSLHPGHVGTYSEEPDDIILLEDGSDLDETTEFPGSQFVFVDTPVFTTSTPKVRMSEDRSLQLLFDELRGIKQELVEQEKKWEKVSETTLHVPEKSSPEKTPLPPKYDGCTDFCTYRVQFEVLAKQQKWSQEKQGVMLLSRLKGRALDVAAQGEDLSYTGLVSRLKSHFSPEHEEMFAQKLQALRKSSSQTWEDLAFEVRLLTRKAYGNSNDETKERLGVHAFVNAITDDGLRQKVRDAHPSTIQAALDRVRQVEADQAIEQQRHHKTDDTKGVIHVVHDEESEQNMRDLKKEVEELRRELKQKLSGATSKSEGQNPRGNSRGPRNPRGLKCYFCDSPDHLLRDCPHKLKWRRDHKASQTKRGNGSTGSEQPLNF